MDPCDHLRDESDRFAAALRDLPDHTTVPTCPGWDAHELAWHLTRVQWSWGRRLRERITDPRDQGTPPERPATLAATLTLFGEVSAALEAAMREAPDDAPVWSWHPGGDNAAWLARRQVHEALVHRLDAEIAAGLPSEVDTHLAVDGIDELLDVFVLGVPDWATFAEDGRHVRIETDASTEAWGLLLGTATGTDPRTERVFEGDTAFAAAVAGAAIPPDSDVVISGDAAVVHAWLWGRGPADDLVVTGDRSLLDDVRSLVAEAT